MALTTLTLAGVAAYVTRRAVKRASPSGEQSRQPEAEPATRLWGLPLSRDGLASLFARPGQETDASVERNLLLSAGMLGLTTVGRLTLPVVSLAALPVLVYLNLPFLHKAKAEVVEEKKVGIGVLDSVASLGMLALGDLFADALFLSLYYTSCRFLDLTRGGKEPIEEVAESAAEELVGELEGERLVAWGSLPMLALGAVTLPLLGARQAVAVLVSNFGFDLRVVAPLSVLSYLQVAEARGIHITDGRALEALQADDLLLVLDRTTAARPEARRVIEAFEAQGRRVLIWEDNREDDWKDNAPPADPTDDLTNDPTGDPLWAALADRPWVFVAQERPPAHLRPDLYIALNGANGADADQAHIRLADADLSRLEELFTMADALQRDMRGIFVVTVVPNLICLAGIYFLHFGIVTSIVLNYLGLGMGAVYALSPRYFHNRRWLSAPDAARTEGTGDNEPGDIPFTDRTGETGVSHDR